MVLEIIQFSSTHSSATENIRVLKYLILANVLTSPSLTTKFIICDISISLASCNVQVCHFPRWHKSWDSIHYCIFVSTSSVVFFCFIFFWLGDPADLLTKFLFLRKRVWMFKYFIRTYFFWQQGSPDIERPRHLVDLRWIWLLIGLRMQYISTMNNIKVNSFLWMK